MNRRSRPDRTDLRISVLNSTADVLAIVPARGGSKGLPRKNVLPLAGRPLITHTLDAAAAAVHVTTTIVNTDDDEIADVAKSSGIEVVRRPAAMGNDTAKVDPLLIWTVERFERTHRRSVDVVVLLYPTAPLRPSTAIDATISRVIHEGCDSALTLVADHSYLWRVDGAETRPTNYDPANRAPRQTERWNQYRENKAVYAMRRDLLMDTGCRLGGRIGWVEMSPVQSIDVDGGDDLAMAEALLSRPYHARVAA